MEISLDSKIVTYPLQFRLECPFFSANSLLFPSFPTRLKICSPSHTYLSLFLASLPSLKHNDLDDEAKRMLTEAAKTRGVTLKL